MAVLFLKDFFMKSLFLCAVAVGGATVIGALLGFIFKKQAERHSGTILSVSAGIMLAAAIMNLITPALEGATVTRLFLAVLGLFVGAATIYFTERFIPIGSPTDKGARSAILFSLAMGIHNLPEGVAAGLGFGTGDTRDAIMVTLGVALHNIPEGMISVFPMLSAGVRPRRAFAFAMAGGAAEVIGTLLGNLAAEVAAAALPFALSFAGGTMLYVVAGEMIPEGQLSGRRRGAFSLIFGYSLMVVLNFLFSSK